MASEAIDGSTRAGLRRHVDLGDDFARTLPELGVPWQAVRPERPEILALNEALAVDLGLDPDWLRSERGLRFLVGEEVPEGASPVAQAYAGHQFGAYNPRLGDGRALLLGEIRDSGGRLRDLHLKGSGPTPFARADGYAAAGPMLREYLMGEAMHALGVPTTRALAVVSTGRRLFRDESLDP
ncbi:MAG: protein adenylyltransferase SelO family protein, partial [Leucobacter sp.]